MDACRMQDRGTEDGDRLNRAPHGDGGGNGGVPRGAGGSPGHRSHLAVRLATVLLTALGLLVAGTGTGAAAEATATPAGAEAGAPATWRVDYFHTGGPGLDEVLSLDRIVVEPLPWPGNPRGHLDPTGFGVYRFEVRDGDGTVLYSRGFSPLFAEWQLTAEAERRHRTFHDSLRFPAPAGPVEVVVLRRDGGDFREVWRVPVDPGDPFVDPSSPQRRELLEIEVHGPPADKLDLLLLGDGWTAGQCRTRFPAAARRMLDALFAHQPFTRRRTDFNVWGLCPPSPEEGVSRPSTGTHVRTPLGTTYDVLGAERYMLTYDNRAWRDVAAWAPYEVVVILANASTYGGGGLYNGYAAVAVESAWADYLFVHELGHHLAGLADEYYVSPVAYRPPERVEEPWEPNVTALLDPAALKWGDLVTEGTPIPTPWPKEPFEHHAREVQRQREAIRADGRPEAAMSLLFREQQLYESRLLLTEADHAGVVGAFQGANYDARAFYRPQVDCVMFSRDEVPFCAVCQRAIEAVLDLYAPPPSESPPAP